jgi:hypothetical protein
MVGIVSWPMYALIRRRDDRGGRIGSMGIVGQDNSWETGRQSWSVKGDRCHDRASASIQPSLWNT